MLYLYLRGHRALVRFANSYDHPLYNRCVEARNAESGGLRDGDECEKEGEEYRECRKKVKEFKQSQASAASVSSK